MRERLVKLLILYSLVMLLFTVLSGCNKDDESLQNVCQDFAQTLEQKNMDGLYLKIYYTDPSLLTYAPLTVNDLLRKDPIIVDHKQINEQLDLLKRLNIENMIPVRNSSGYLHARLCYIFETEHGKKILEIAVGGENNSVFVNGIEVAYNDIFRDVLEPFVTEEVMNDLEYIFEGTLKTSNKTD